MGPVQVMGPANVMESMAEVGFMVEMVLLPVMEMVLLSAVEMVLLPVVEIIMLLLPVVEMLITQYHVTNITFATDYRAADRSTHMFIAVLPITLAVAVPASFRPSSGLCVLIPTRVKRTFTPPSGSAIILISAFPDCKTLPFMIPRRSLPSVPRGVSSGLVRVM
jgi:hypothetical protein